ncbi:MAG TPA: mycofactocin-coupled SDR family oxidoreductase [Ilumatobacteraceae bacterium]|jgi:SDR family mycofactocin-dependent oxidoreductase
MGTLDGRVALITGAARGMGRSHAVRLAEAGADIIAIDICRQIESMTVRMSTRADLDETAELVAKTGRRVVCGVADVRDRPALRAAVADGVHQLGRLDTVVANAGIWAVRLDQPTDDAGRTRVWEDTLGVNLTGVWNTIEVCRPFMVAAGNGGSIIVISSTAALQTVSNDDIAFTSYAVSKVGLIGLMKMAASDLAADSIRVNAVHPTGVETPLVSNSVVDEYFAHHTELSAQVQSAYSYVDAGAISDAVLFLASDASRSISGISLPVDSGALVRWR